MEKRSSVKLIMVDPCNVNTGAQNNKFYTMIDNGNGTFKAIWGRVGQSENTKENTEYNLLQVDLDMILPK